MANGAETLPVVPEADVLDPNALLAKAGVEPGMIVADMGAGREGSFVFTAAQMVGPTGRVYALDVVEDVLEVLKNLAEQNGFENVYTVWTDLELLGAAKEVTDGLVDVGIVANTLFQSEQQEDMLRECARMVKGGGHLLVVDWKPVDSPFGPPKEQRVSAETIKQYAATVGLSVVEEFDAGEYHWGLLLRKG